MNLYNNLFFPKINHFGMPLNLKSWLNAKKSSKIGQTFYLRKIQFSLIKYLSAWIYVICMYPCTNYSVLYTLISESFRFLAVILKHLIILPKASLTFFVLFFIILFISYQSFIRKLRVYYKRKLCICFTFSYFFTSDFPELYIRW